MTINATIRRMTPVAGNGVNRNFVFNFKVFAASDVAFTTADADGVETDRIFGVDYIVTLNPNQDTTPGGTVTYPANLADPPLPAGHLGVVYSAVPYTQVTSLPTGGRYEAKTVENMVDRAVALLQQVLEAQGRTLSLPVTADPGIGTVLPAPVDGRVIGWGGSPVGLRNIDITTFASVIAYGNARTLVANGGLPNYTLAADPGSVHNTRVAVGGVVQTPGVDYNVVGTLLTPTTPWPVGVGNVVINYGEALPVGTQTADQVTFLQSGANAVSRSVQAKLREAVSVKDFGAVGDGVTDDTAAIQAAIDSITAAGGRVVFPTPAVYRVENTITVTSDHAITLESEMGSDNTSDPESYISIAAAIAGPVFNISARGSRVRGLWFRDPTSSLGAAQGTNTVHSALKLTVFGMGVVERCAFDGIKGSAIEANNFIRGHLDSLHIRDCGDTSRPAVWLNPSSPLTVGQVTITGLHAEVCRSAPYLKIEANAVDTKVVGGQFEADTLLAASNQIFIQDLGQRTTISACGFNRNTATQVELGGVRGRLAGGILSAASGVPSAPQLVTSGAYNIVSGTHVIGTSAATATAINDTGSNNTFAGVQCYFGGNVILGASSTWTGGAVFASQTAEAYAMVTGANSAVSGAIVSNSLSAGGIRIPSAATVVGCQVISNPGIGIRNESTTAVIQGNRAASNTGGDFSFTNYPHGYDPNANHASDGSYPLQASTTWNPGNLANGASASVDVTVTGAAIGDAVIAAFPMLVAAVAQAGMQVSGSVTAANTVKVVITNNSGGAVDLDSATLRVKVLKA